MQLCALDAEGRLVRATFAQRQSDYYCLECGQVVRLRKGLHRQAHYYHSHPNGVCRLSGKSLVHITVQNRILEMLPQEEAEMEYRFPSIGRIADVAWIPQKIVFEIQCASITAEEVMGRNAGYASVGFDVVWILHCNRYNKARVTSAEDVLSSYAHYYTDIDTQGKGSFFDHFAVIETGRRIWRFPSFPIDITNPFMCSDRKAIKEVPLKFLGRYRNWTRGFAEDYLDVLSKDPQHEKLIESFLKLKNDIADEGNLHDQLLLFLRKWVFHPYQVVLRHILEKASR